MPILGELFALCVDFVPSLSIYVTRTWAWVSSICPPDHELLHACCGTHVGSKSLYQKIRGVEIRGVIVQCVQASCNFAGSGSVIMTGARCQWSPGA
eukprot:4572238-Amphidinium_carterae.1